MRQVISNLVLKLQAVLNRHKRRTRRGAMPTPFKRGLA
jgi:hypothetical protein